MKFPYGISDFRKIMSQGCFYCDRTDSIPLLEQGEYLLFLRPRRFGKTLLLSMLANYYDTAREDEFRELFGDLKIGENPTSLHNQYLILKWDFSCIDPFGTARDIRQALHDHINSRIRRFTAYYKDRLNMETDIDPYNALNSIESMVTAARMSSYPVYLFIDEYDNFANEVMMGARREKKKLYEALVYEEGPLKTVFKAVKSSTSESLFDRIFITGVSPVVMSDITSGYNIAENIYTDAEFNDLCGLHEAEIEAALKKITGECGLDDQDADSAASMMRTYYNGYRFSPDAETLVYNPSLAIYFMKAFQKTCKYPRKMLDANLAADEAKLRYVSKIPRGSQMLMDMMKEDHQVVISELADRFGIQEMLKDQSKDNIFMASFLYYFGVLTTEGETSRGNMKLKVPNLVMRGLYVGRILRMLLPKPAERDDGVLAAKQLYAEGKIEPLCEFIEQKYFQVFRNRDYRWANELTVKTAFLTLLYNDILYIMDSEKEVRRGDTDLTMIVRPDMRRFDIFDVLIEFRYVSLKKAGMTGEKARGLSRKELGKIPDVSAEMNSAEEQVRKYGDALKQKYDKIRLRQYAVVSLGFERLWWKEIGEI
ncbi:AAA family ATPase [Desulfococcaceae bacterium HSG8]|nr:AAA family ATPase [Desulfococcaceae bacterium HSG8]